MLTINIFRRNKISEGDAVYLVGSEVKEIYDHAPMEATVERRLGIGSSLVCLSVGSFSYHLITYLDLKGRMMAIGCYDVEEIYSVFLSKEKAIAARERLIKKDEKKEREGDEINAAYELELENES